MKVLAISDMHCGAHYGLTPPHITTAMPKAQAEMWQVATQLQKLKPDVILFCGDAIDGDGRRNGGSDLFETDRQEQALIATACLKYLAAKNAKCKIYMVRGTPYHVGDAEDWEDMIAREVGAVISNRHWVEVEGVVFDMKHKVGGSGIPHGRSTAIMREQLWGEQWHYHQGHPLADIALRGHVHYFNYCGGPGRLGMTLPALCGLGSDYGTRQCSGEVHFGGVLFDCKRGDYTWSRDKFIHTIQASVPKVEKA